MTVQLTVKELALRERVSERTVYRWIEKGALAIRRTPGGGVRIVERSDVAILQLHDEPRASRA